MQKERTLLEQTFQFKIHAEWDVESATYFTERLYHFVDRGDINLEINAKKGSLITEIVITVLTGLATDVLYDLIKIIFRLLREKKEKGNPIKPVYIFTLTEKFTITGDKDSKIPEELKKELFY